MRITQLRIRSFRSYSDARIELAPSLTLFLGENNVGKSAAMLALTRLLTQMTPGSDQIDSGDLRYGQGRDLAIEAYIELTDGERDDILDLAFPGPSSTRAQSEPALAEWLKQRGNEIVLSLKRPLLGIPAPLLQWRDLFFLGDWVWLGEHSDYEAAVRAGRMAGRAASLPSIQPADLAEPAVIGRNFVEGLGRFLFEHLKVVREFRTASAGGRTEA
ncbi:MAG: ATP-binding protein, partial [Chloroflexi bacterium]|nr:ATP-binding protein [Chloroflexota bacterium]